MRMDLTRELVLAKGCNLKRELGLMGLMTLRIVRVDEWLVFENAVIVAEVS